MMLDSPVSFCIFWGPSYVQFYNDAFIPYFGHTRHPEAMGKPVQSPSQRWSSTDALFEKVINGKTEHQKNIKIPIDKNGFTEDCFFNVSYMPLYLEDGTVGGIYSFIEEITENVREIEKVVAERTLELEEANLSLYKSNLELSQYAYVASHDLQEPLRKIMIFSGLLFNQENLAEESKPLITKIRHSSERMSMLIKDLLEYSKLLNSEKMFRPVDLNEVVHAVISDFDLRINEKNAVITVGKLPVIEGIALQINQLFYNLIGNALKFTSEGTTPGIDIYAKQIEGQDLEQHIQHPLKDVDWWDITIKDNGIGFEEKYAEQILEVFKRLHPKDIYPGSGIGLSLCRKIVQNHYGYMYAKSKVSVGSTFHLILPLSKPV